jgi:hypothetical protein
VNTTIGLLVGRERNFPEALIEAINGRDTQGVRAEMVRLAGTRLDEQTPYRVILDRISHEVPYYRAYLTKAVADGTIVVNNPFWWSADNKFVECVIAERLGVAVPRTVLLPNVSYEADIIDESLRNLEPSLPWQDIATYIGMPAVLKPAIGGGSKNVSVVDTVDELIAAYQESGHLTMIVQECIVYDNYARCWVIGRNNVRVSGYDYHKPHAERYRIEHRLETELYDRIVRDCLTLTRALGYDMDTVEFAVREGVPYAIDFLNPAPDCDPPSVGRDNFEWVVEHTADLLIRYATGKKLPPPAPTAGALATAVPAW